MVNDRTPVIIGAAQLLQREDDIDRAREPFELMAAVARDAATDAGCDTVLAQLDSIRVVRGRWSYGDPGRALAEDFGAAGAESVLAPYGGNTVQRVMNMNCVDIRDGRNDAILLVGAECGRTQARFQRAGRRWQWRELPGTPDRSVGEELDMVAPEEAALGIEQPIEMYPIMENALRYRRGWSLEEHQQRISSLWSRFSEVAADNPNAWIRTPASAEAIRTPGPTNRMVSFPYTKLMNSNSSVDMAGAVLLTSAAKARALGVPESNWVYPLAGTDGADTTYASNRDSLSRSPAIRIAGQRLLELAGVAPSALDFVDLYSCFPVAVQVAAEELQLDLEQPLTITGGLTFGGGPLNDYVMHSIARAVELIRAAPERKGLVTANGGFLTKHAFGLYSGVPPESPFVYENLQARIDAEPRRPVLADFDGSATVEGYTVMYGSGGAERGLFAALTDAGERVWGVTRDADLMAAMTRDEFCGRTVRRAADGTIAP